MPCYTRLEIKVGLKFPAHRVIEAVAKIQGWKLSGNQWVHTDGTRLSVKESKASLTGPNAKAHIKPITTEIVRQHAVRYGWKVQTTTQGLNLSK